MAALTRVWAVIARIQLQPELVPLLDSAAPEVRLPPGCCGDCSAVPHVVPQSSASLRPNVALYFLCIMLHVNGKSAVDLGFTVATCAQGNISICMYS